MSENNSKNFEKFKQIFKSKKGFSNTNKNFFKENQQNILTPQESKKLLNNAMKPSLKQSLKELEAAKLKCESILEFNPNHEIAYILLLKITETLELYNSENSENLSTKKIEDLLNELDEEIKSQDF